MLLSPYHNNENRSCKRGLLLTLPKFSIPTLTFQVFESDKELQIMLVMCICYVFIYEYLRFSVQDRL